MIAKPVSRLVQELDATSFTVLGCGCHGGLGGESLLHLRSGLAGAEGECVVIAGDISPIGRDPYYHTVAGFVDAHAARPVHVLRGNHDGPDFSEYFGQPNRAVLADAFSLIMLDNSERRFSGETLDFLRETMAIVNSPNVIVAFHIPPPNRISGNTLSLEEWRRFEDALGVWHKRVTLLLCGHDHCYYEDEVDGLRLVVAGGGAHTPPLERAALPEAYALEISFGSDHAMSLRRRVFDATRPDRHSSDIHYVLRDVLDAECRALVELRLNAEDAHLAGQHGLADCCRAACEAGLSRARLLRSLLSGSRGPGVEELGVLFHDDGANREDDSPDQSNDMLARHILAAITRTRDNTLSLLGRFKADPAAQAPRYFLCTSCAMLHSGTEAPNYCPLCGAPYHNIREVK